MPSPRDLAALQDAARERVMRIYSDRAALVAEKQFELLDTAPPEVQRGVASDIMKQIMGAPTQRIEQDIRAMHVTRSLPIPEEKLTISPAPLQLPDVPKEIPIPTSNRALSPPIVFPPTRKPFSRVANAVGEKKDEPPKSIEPSMVPE